MRSRKTERTTRGELGSDDCVIDKSSFFVRGCLEIPVHGAAEPLVWGVWVSLSGQSFRTWVEVFGREHRSAAGPFFGWLNARLKPYPDTTNLKTRVHLRDRGVRPWVELEATDHPIAVEQRHGITVDRVAEIYRIMMHSTGHCSLECGSAA
jgi:hypothetical protein